MPFINTLGKEGGLLTIDHRASPGTKLVPEGSVQEIPTMQCKHCGGVVVLNPQRMRARSSCQKCGGGYICDICEAHTHKPDYVHRSIYEVMDMVNSGRYTVSGTAAAPILTPITSMQE